MTSPANDRMTCGVAPWVAYVLSPGGQQLAVYHGRHIYPVEFRSYGPDGINVIFERNQAGAWVKRFANLDRQGSVLAVSGAAGNPQSTTYEEFGTRNVNWNRRTGWLDRERDYESSPLSAWRKLYDLEARKYDASTGQFLSVDPLWPLFVSSGSYVYCTGDPVNSVDPWGLAGDGVAGHPPTPGTGPKHGPPMITVTDPNAEAEERHAFIQAQQADFLALKFLVPLISDGLIAQAPFSLQPNAVGGGRVKSGENGVYTKNSTVSTTATSTNQQASTSNWRTAGELLIRTFVPDYLAIDFTISGIMFGGFGGSGRIVLAIRGTQPGVYLQGSAFGGVGANSSISVSGVRGWYASMSPNTVDVNHFFGGPYISPSIGGTVLPGVGLSAGALFNRSQGLAGFEIVSSLTSGVAKATYVFGFSWPVALIQF